MLPRTGVGLKSKRSGKAFGTYRGKGVFLVEFVVWPGSRYNRCVMSKLAQFEAAARRLVEGSFARAFAGRLRPVEVTAHLSRAIEEGQVSLPDGAVQAPTHYWIYLNREDREALSASHLALTDDLADRIVALASEADLVLPGTPILYVMTDPELKPHDVRVEARWLPGAVPTMERTREILPGNENEEQEDDSVPPGRPFLILDGKRHVNLNAPLVAMGRALDNSVIFEDSRVSRHHAQLRRRYGRYVLFDVGSARGTRVNGYRIKECVLHSGDVISLGGVDVIYGEDPPTPYPLPTTEDTPSVRDNKKHNN